MGNTPRSPRVFVSHASEDKARFVVQFAQRLRELGIDVWLDQWEIAPGDSLVDKIFEEGIGRADAFIVVLSSISVTKAWVREELNAQVVKRITDKSKLVPVVIDDCESEIPVAIRSIAWQRVHDLNAPEPDIQRIAMAIWGVQDKPPLGSKPQYVANAALGISDLAAVDSLVLHEVCRQVIDGDQNLVTIEDVLAAMEQHSVGEDACTESVEVLDSRGYVEAHRAMGPKPIFAVSTTTFGLDEYLSQAYPSYAEIFANVVVRIVNYGGEVSMEIAEQIAQPHLIVCHIFKSLEARGLIRMDDVGGGMLGLLWQSPELRRALSG
jgi:hypothetical protein